MSASKTTTSPGSLLTDDGGTRAIVRFVFRAFDPTAVEVRILREGCPVVAVEIDRGTFAQVLAGMPRGDFYRLGDTLVLHAGPGFLVTGAAAAESLLAQVEAEQVEAVIAAVRGVA